MEVGAKLCEVPSSETCSGGRLETPSPIPCGTRIVAQSKVMLTGPLECSLALEMVAAEARLCVATQQAARTFPWIGTDDLQHENRLRDEQRGRMQKIQNFLSVAAQKILSVLMTRDMLCKKMEAWRTNGIQIIVTLSVAHYWFCPICSWR